MTDLILEIEEKKLETDIQIIGPAVQPNDLEIEKTRRDNAVYEALKAHTVEEGIDSFLTVLKPSTARAYKSSLTWLKKKGILSFDQRLSEFALVNYSMVLGGIRGQGLSLATEQARAAAFISFTKYLNTRSNNLIPRCQPVTTGVEKTFGRLREKGTTKPLSRFEARHLLEILKVLHFQTYVISFICLNAGRRITEVLELRWRDVDFDKKQITFVVKKLTFEKRVSVTYEDGLFADLGILKRCNPFSQSASHIFLRTNGQPISYSAVWARFKKASKVIGKEITPHCLRSTFVSLAAQEGHSHTEIKGVTGHSSVGMVEYYDHNTELGTLTKKFTVV